MGDASKKDPVTALLPAHSPAKRPTSLTSSLEVIASGGEEVKKKKKADDQSFLPTFWDDANMAALKAYKALSMDDLGPLMAKSSNEVMSSHIKKLVQIIEAVVVKDFKDSDEYSNELYGYYVEGFDILRKCIAKHHPNLDLSGLVMNDVEKELLVNRPSEATAGNVMEEATNVAEVIEEAPITTSTKPVPNK
nr:hypothetical protein CFP56_75070 [Quercus suber]